MLAIMFTRMLTALDAESFHRLRRRALDEEAEVVGTEPAWMDSAAVLAEWFKTKWSGQSSFVMGAFDAALVGIIGCHRDGDSAAMLWGMYVIPKRRRQGVGKRLVLDAIVRAKQWHDLEHLWLDVATTNRPARTLYVSCGFRIIGSGTRPEEDRMTLDLR